jgi:hypothetical protein
MLQVTIISERPSDGRRRLCRSDRGGLAVRRRLSNDVPLYFAPWPGPVDRRAYGQFSNISGLIGPV